MSVGLDTTLRTLGLNRAFADQIGQMVGTRVNAKAGLEALLFAQYAALGQQTQPSSNGTMPPNGWVPGPAEFLGSSAGNLRALVGNGYGGVNAPQALGGTPVATSIQAALLTQPGFRDRLEQGLKGQVVGPNAKGGVTVWRPQNNRIGTQTRSMLTSAPPAGSIQFSLGNMNTQLNPGTLGGPTGGILRGLAQLEGNIASMVQGWTSKNQDPAVMKAAQQAGVNIKNPNFEDMMFLNMMTYTTKKEKDIMGKVEQLSGNATGAATANATGTQAGNGFFGGLTQTVGGTMSRTLGVQLPGSSQFPSVGSAVGQTAAAATPGAAAATGVAGTTGTTAAAATAAAAGGTGVNPAEMSETAKQQMLQKMMGDLQKLYEMLSNILKTMHDMQMTPIRNLK